jgi:hypothetical protein
MNPTRILPDLQASLLAEDIRQEASGNFILVGIIGYIHVPQLPAVALKLCVFNRWTAGIGNFSELVRLIAPDGKTVLRESKTTFALPSPNHHITNGTLFAQPRFETAGVYYIEVHVDEVLKIRYPVPVTLVTPPGGQAGAAPEQATTTTTQS